MTTNNLDSVEFYQPPSRAEPAGRNPVVTSQYKGETAEDTRDGDAGMCKVQLNRDDLTNPGNLKGAAGNHSESGRGDNWSWDKTIPLSLWTLTASPSPTQPPVLGQSPLQGRAAHSVVDQARSPFVWSLAPSTSAAGSEARCDPRNPYSLIPILTDGGDLDVLSSILLYPLIPSFRRFMIYKPADQATVLTKTSSIITHLVRGKRRWTKQMGTTEMSGRVGLGARPNL